MRLLVIACLLFAGNEFSCSAPPTAVVFESCPHTTVTVQVATGPIPLVGWSPSCGMSQLMVFPDGGLPAVWTVYGNSAGSDNPIASGVRYGQTPDDARTVGGPEPLQRGVTYRVELSRLVCEQGALCTLQPAGGARFQP